MWYSHLWGCNFSEKKLKNWFVLLAAKPVEERSCLLYKFTVVCVRSVGTFGSAHYAKYKHLTKCTWVVCS